MGTACGPDKSKGHSAVDLIVPDEFRFFGCSGVDFKLLSNSELDKGDWWGEFVEDIEVDKLEAAADLAKDRRA